MNGPTAAIPLDKLLAQLPEYYNLAERETIKRELGWAPEFASLEAIIGTAWEWHRSHPNGYGA